MEEARQHTAIAGSKGKLSVTEKLILLVILALLLSCGVVHLLLPLLEYEKLTPRILADVKLAQTILFTTLLIAILLTGLAASRGLLPTLQKRWTQSKAFGEKTENRRALRWFRWVIVAELVVVVWVALQFQNSPLGEFVSGLMLYILLFVTTGIWMVVMKKNQTSD